MSNPRPEQPPVRAQDVDEILRDLRLTCARMDDTRCLPMAADACNYCQAATLIERQAARLATLEQERDEARNSIRKAHDLVGRPTTDARHDLAACLIDGILNIQEGLGVARKAEDAAEAHCKALEQERDELMRALAADANAELAEQRLARVQAEARCTTQAETIARLEQEVGRAYAKGCAFEAERVRAHTLPSAVAVSAAIESVLLETDVPDLVLAKDVLGVQHYLCALLERTDDGDHFMAVGISNSRLGQFRSGTIDLLQAFTTPEKSEFFKGRFARVGGQPIIDLEPIEQFPSEWLPKPGFFLTPDG